MQIHFILMEPCIIDCLFSRLLAHREPDNPDSGSLPRALGVYSSSLY